MSETKIEWTGTPREDGTIAPGYTHNGWIGCSKISPACKFCYAEAQTNARPAFVLGQGVPRIQEGRRLPIWGDAAPRRVTNAANWRKPLKWDRDARLAGERHKVFCFSLADVFEDYPGFMSGSANAPIWMSEKTTMQDARWALWRLILQTPNLDYLLVTKRPENVPRMVPPEWMTGDWPFNVWLGFTAEDQEHYNTRLLFALQAPAPVIFCSYEPALGPIEFGLLGTIPKDISPNYSLVCDRLKWVICGGESGHHARPMDLTWARSARDQCREADVAYFFKQQGALRRVGEFSSFEQWVNKAQSWIGGTGAQCYDAKMRRCHIGADMQRARDEGAFPVSFWIGGKDKGGDMDTFPADLRVREFPRVLLNPEGAEGSR